MADSKFNHWYIPSRPVTFADMGEYRWRWVQIPRSLAHQGGGLPISGHEFGVIVTDRFVLQSHLEKIGLRRWTVDEDRKIESLIAAFPRAFGKDEKDEDDD
jgi:hypothetical protein